MLALKEFAAIFLIFSTTNLFTDVSVHAQHGAPTQSVASHGATRPFRDCRACCLRCSCKKLCSLLERAAPGRLSAFFSFGYFHFAPLLPSAATFLVLRPTYHRNFQGLTVFHSHEIATRFVSASTQRSSPVLCCHLLGMHFQSN